MANFTDEVMCVTDANPVDILTTALIQAYNAGRRHPWGTDRDWLLNWEDWKPKAEYLLRELDYPILSNPTTP